MSVPTVCLDCGVPSYSTRCPTHTRSRNQTRRPAFRERYGPEYQRQRAMVLRGVTRCPQCGSKPTARNPMSVDHVVPLAAGGSHAPSNLRPLCLDCNRRKRTRGVG